MEKGKKYISKFKGDKYNVFINPSEDMKKYEFTVHSGDTKIGSSNGWVNSVTDAQKQASQMILDYYKKQKTLSADGTTTVENKVNKGSIKLAWLDSDKTDGVLHSQTFDTIADALKNANKEKKNWVIFKLVNENNNESSWELLPYGDYRNYRRAVNVTSNFLVKTGAIILSSLGIYFILTKLKPFILKS